MLLAVFFVALKKHDNYYLTVPFSTNYLTALFVVPLAASGHLCAICIDPDHKKLLYTNGDDCRRFSSRGELASVHVISGTETGSLIPGIIWYFFVELLAGAVMGWLLSSTTELLKGCESAAPGVINGVMLWVVFGLLLVPTLGGMGPQWQPDNVAAQFPLLLYVIQGIVLALALYTLQVLSYLHAAPIPVPGLEEKRAITHRKLIPGGGFPGHTIPAISSRFHPHHREICPNDSHTLPENRR